MARTLQDIISEIQGTYQPQVDSLRQRQALVPEQIRSEEQGLQARQEQAFGDILSGARRRGLGFSGIPVGEQARYTSTEYLPALARLRQSGREQAMGLEDAINQIYERRNTLAQQVRQQEVDRDWQREQFDRQLAAQREAASAARATIGNFGGDAGGQSTQGGGGVRSVQRGDGGFNFFDQNGNPISAAQYAQYKGQSFRSVLDEMAKAGDKGAASALGFVGDDFGYDPNKITNRSLADLYNALVWGTGRNASFSTPSSAPLPSLRNNFFTTGVKERA